MKTDLTRSDMTYIFLRLSQMMVKREYVKVFNRKIDRNNLNYGSSTIFSPNFWLFYNGPNNCSFLTKMFPVLSPSTIGKTCFFPPKPLSFLLFAQHHDILLSLHSHHFVISHHPHPHPHPPLSLPPINHHSLPHSKAKSPFLPLLWYKNPHPAISKNKWGKKKN